MAGDPKFEASQVVPAFGFAHYAEMIGLRGIRVEAPEEVGPAWDRSLSAACPVVLEAITDPEVPTLPPHISIEQAKKVVSSILKGDPNRGGMIRGALKDALESFLPHKQE